MANATEILRAAEEYGQRYYDEDHPDYTDDGYENVWDVLVAERKDIEIPGLGTLALVENGEELDTFGDKRRYLIFLVEDQTFKIEGWEDSWGGESGWDGPLYEVEAKQVTTTVWEKKA